MRPEIAAAVHAAAELLPVSSSGHLRAVGGAGDGDAAAHAAPLLVTLVVWRADVRATLRGLSRRRVAFHAAAGAIPAVAGVLVGDRRRRLSLPAGMAVGALVLAAGDRAGGDRSRDEAGPADGVALGLAQAASLWPGVSRLGTTLAVARGRGFAAGEAALLAREAGVPVTVGALLWQCRHPAVTGWPRFRTATVHELDHPLGGGGGVRVVGAAVLGAAAAVPLARRVDRGGSLTPYVLERLAVALLLLRQSRAHE